MLTRCLEIRPSRDKCRRKDCNFCGLEYVDWMDTPMKAYIHTWFCFSFTASTPFVHNFISFLITLHLPTNLIGKLKIMTYKYSKSIRCFVIPVLERAEVEIDCQGFMIKFHNSIFENERNRLKRLEE
uniref:Uncharacterized protein n=1 Tax=Glossina brevipalpis TaxID=37001 RepID=A0A1A9WLI5_9MUSC